MSFLGAYEVGLGLFPGLPDIELGQFYILISLIKAIRTSKSYPVFFNRSLQILFIYLLFLIGWGMINGMPSELNEFLRIIKLTFPLLLFYSMPHLIRNEGDYQRFFYFIFPVALLAFLTHIFTIITGISPAEFIGAREMSRYTEQYTEKAQLLRVFYNSRITLLTFFASLFYLIKEDSRFNRYYLICLLFSTIAIVFLSATRGWIISFSFVLVVYSIVILRMRLMRILGLIIILILLVPLSMRNPRINKQIQVSLDRFSTVTAITEGDITLDKTQERTSVRSPKVMKKWSESPLFGWGFSNTYFEYDDTHVGNQNILLHAGFIGALLLLVFFVRFNYKLIAISFLIKQKNIKKSFWIIVLFFFGWFIIHSTSGQHFAFMNMPGEAITQSFFFSFGAYCYYQARNKIHIKSA
jgi:hypothetical protein